MLIRTFATVASALALASLVPAVGQAEQWSSYAISGSAAKGLEAAFRAEYGLTSRSDDTNASVHIAETSGAVQVWFDRGAGSRNAYLVNEQTDSLQQLSAPQATAAEVVLPGPDAKAIAMAYRAWHTSAVRLPFPRADFESNSFTVSERAILNSPQSRPGYYVTYTPAATSKQIGGLNCGTYVNYRVDPSTWQVVIQAPIC